MNIITILGSPRKMGNTATVLRWFEESLGEQHIYQRINLVDYIVNGCEGCDGCQGTTGEPGCLQNDDALWMLRDIQEADLVVYTTPVYVWGFAAQMKALMDRHYCMTKWDMPGSPALLEGKRVMLLATCGGGASDNADLLFEAFRREADYLKCTVAGLYVVDNCPAPHQLGDHGHEVATAMAADVEALAAQI